METQCRRHGLSGSLPDTLHADWLDEVQMTSMQATISTQGYRQHGAPRFQGQNVTLTRKGFSLLWVTGS